MWKNLKKSNIVLILICILMLSLISNIYSIYKIENYKYRIGNQSYVAIQDIKQRNESNMEVLSKSINNKNISNEEILKLYKNYDVMSSNIIELWQQYSDYKSNSITSLSKKIDTDKIIQNDINGNIKEYIYSTLTKEMKNEKSKLILKEDNLERFNAMEEMSKDIYNYFNEFDIEKLKGCSEEEKKKKIINRNYWIDMLNGIYNISDNYADIQWNVESADD